MRIGGEVKREIFIVLSCVIYTIIGKYVCIDYLGSKKSKLIYLRLGGTGRYKHNDTYYDNIIGDLNSRSIIEFVVLSRIFK